MRFSDDPEGFLAAHRISISAPGVEGHFLVEVDVMGQYEDLFDVSGSLAHLIEQRLDQTANDEEDIAIQTRHRIVEDHYTVSRQAAFRIAAFEQKEKNGGR